MEKTIELMKLDVSKYTEKKGKFTYLSWASAWAEFIKVYPSATYEIKKNDLGLPLFGNKELGYMSYTTVTVGDITHEMWLPVLDFSNKAMMNPKTFDINKTVMRCLTKNLAMFGLGLYIYAGEDLPEETINPEDEARTKIFHIFKTDKDLTEEYKNKLIDAMKSKKRTYVDVLEELTDNA